ncbi:MAG: ATP-binding protein [Candidatus Competibacter sp.]|nr:ATP-binding protein [Candidatus Competibacter sp.]MDG4583367.1 ATP-binding protein [Candidatus Competibacter sp.]
MKNIFAVTSNAERFIGAIRALENRGAAESTWVLLTGVPGLGKTELAEWWALTEDAVYLRAKAAWTPRAAQLELAERLGIAPSRGNAELFGQILSTLGRNPTAIVIDEVEHCLRDAKVLEVFRDLSDLLEIPIVIVGMDAVRTKIQRHEQISSRIHQVVDFLPATLADVRIMAETLVELPLRWHDDLIEKICVESEGRYRLIMDALAVVERQAKRGGATAVHAADFPERLTHDWRLRVSRHKAARANKSAKPDKTALASAGEQP